jgi:hypothetical protein
MIGVIGATADNPVFNKGQLKVSSLRVDLFPFLCAELAGLGIAVPASECTAVGLAGSVERDEAGFVVTTSGPTYDAIKSFLAAIFSASVFESEDTETLIYRADSSFTTVMLHRDNDTVSLIVLHWKDQGVRNSIIAAQETALKDIVNGAVSELSQLVDKVSTVLRQRKCEH